MEYIQNPILSIEEITSELIQNSVLSSLKSNSCLKLNKISLTLRMKGDIVFLAIQDTGNGFTDAGIKAILSVNIRVLPLHHVLLTALHNRISVAYKCKGSDFENKFNIELNEFFEGNTKEYAFIKNYSEIYTELAHNESYCTISLMLENHNVSCDSIIGIIKSYYRINPQIYFNIVVEKEIESFPNHFEHIGSLELENTTMNNPSLKDILIQIAEVEEITPKGMESVVESKIKGIGSLKCFMQGNKVPSFNINLSEFSNSKKVTNGLFIHQYLNEKLWSSNLIPELLKRKSLTNYGIIKKKNEVYEQSKGSYVLPICSRNGFINIHLVVHLECNSCELALLKGKEKLLRGIWENILKLFDTLKQKSPTQFISLVEDKGKKHFVKGVDSIANTLSKFVIKCNNADLKEFSQNMMNLKEMKFEEVLEGFKVSLRDNVIQLVN